LALAWHQDDRLGHLDSSLAAFEHLLKLEPNNVQAIVHHGLALEDAERYDDALAEYQRATTLAPDDPLPYINLGALLYFQFKRIYDAKVALTKAISLKSDSADAHFNLGVLFADANLFREAKVEWERVLEISPTGAAANLARENLERIRPFLEQQEEGAAAPAGGLPTEAPLEDTSSSHE
jgi:tetratricopeptide (TPR) repeat protein